MSSGGGLQQDKTEIAVGWIRAAPRGIEARRKQGGQHESTLHLLLQVGRSIIWIGL